MFSINIKSTVTALSTAIVLSTGASVMAQNLIDGGFEGTPPNTVIGTTFGDSTIGTPTPGTNNWFNLGRPLLQGDDVTSVTVVTGTMGTTRDAVLDSLDWAQDDTAGAGQESNFAVTKRVFTTPQNYSQNTGLSIRALSSSNIGTTLHLSIGGFVTGTGTAFDNVQVNYEATTGIALDTTIQDISVLFDDIGNFTGSVAGSASGSAASLLAFSNVLANANEVGFTLKNFNNIGTTNEIITFDNLAVTPEPASAMLLGVGMLLIGSRRRIAKA